MNNCPKRNIWGTGILPCYLEMEDAAADKPVLQCKGKQYLEVEGLNDSALVVEFSKEIKLVWDAGKKNISTNLIALTSTSGGYTVKSLECCPFNVAVLILLNQNPKNIDDFIHISRGRIFSELPIACLHMLGYLKF